MWGKKRASGENLHFIFKFAERIDLLFFKISKQLINNAKFMTPPSTSLYILVMWWIKHHINVDDPALSWDEWLNIRKIIYNNNLENPY